MTSARAARVALKAKLFRGLSDPSRLAVLESLRQGPRCVSEVVAATGLSQPSASSHLACLRDCGLVAREPVGRYAYYRIARPEVEAILDASVALLSEVAGLVDECTNYSEG